MLDRTALPSSGIPNMGKEFPPSTNDEENLTKFSVSAALEQFLDLGFVSPEIVKLKSYLVTSHWSLLVLERCLDDIAAILLCEKLSVVNDIVRIFSPILLELVQRASVVDMSPEMKHNYMCVLLGRLVTHSQAAIQYTLKYFKDSHPPFHYKSDSEPPLKKSKTDVKYNISELDICEATYNLLKTVPEHFKEKWDWSYFIEKYSSHPTSEIRWIVCQTIAILNGMSETDTHKLVLQTISEEENRTLSLKYFCPSERKDLNKTIIRESKSVTVNTDILSKEIVDVEGVLLPCFSQDAIKSDIVVPVVSTRSHLQNLALAITSNLPVLISGPVGSGKTTLVEHIAALTGRTIHNQGLLKVQLGDQTDAKVLLGTYHSTDIPGEFMWTAGVLTRAVREGRWLLLEDIDYAPMDVVSMLLPLIESLTLNVPGHGDVIRAAPGFQLFATQRTSNHGDTQTGNAATMLKKMWRRLVIEPFSRSELQTVIDSRFPTLSALTEKLLDAYYLLSEDQTNTRHTINDRSLSPRDFFKWCQRIAAEFRLDNTSLTTINSQLTIFQDALDCFAACVFHEERRLQLAEDIGAKLNLIKAKAEFYCNSYKPIFNLFDDAVHIGRVSLPRLRCDDKTLAGSTFSWTRNSSVLLERLASCVRQLEPVLLVGETGTGKTSTVQYLAQLLGHRLVVINLNQQSDSADLLGGYKPIDLKWKIAPIRQEFERLFEATFSIQQNAKFLSHISTCFANRRWSDLLRLMAHSQQSAAQKCKPELRSEWDQLGYHLQQLRLQIRHADSALAFSFVEGSLVKALKQGDWVLLDEINLATAETLECLSGLLESQQGSLFLLERGDREPVKRHLDFRLFAAMNPATDVGKKQLPTGLRSRFTEFVVDEISSSHDLATLIGDYLRDLNLTSSQIDGIVRFYLEIRGEALRKLSDGTGRQPHFSLRTLCRALVVAASNPCGSVARSLYEAFCLSFLTQLDRSSHPLVERLVVRYVVGTKNLKSVLSQALAQPRALWTGHSESILVEGYWIPKGDQEPHQLKNYILTESVRGNLKDLVRVVSLGRLPVLLQGETSVGKTSLIGYLAQLTGNKCVRVNNHEHTDLQEYVGSYTADASTGKLIFREGVLVDAMRQGYWLILDELNLAPSEVLEALNRLLDDNRELFIAETQETVKAHPRFLLFATQNPPGGNYGGRKLLSRAFRNRFVELHFNDIPTGELETILHQRCDMPPSYCKRCVAVMGELQLRRRGSAAFAGKQGFMTLRDLFRWAERYRLATTGGDSRFYDWDQHLADEGYLVLAGRVRKDEEALVIRQVLEKHFKRTVDPSRLFTLSDDTSPVTRPILESLQRLPGFDHLVWTLALRRLAVLVAQAMRFVEPVLLVGDTGCGKTSVCQYLAGQKNCQLMTINCHQYSEGSDFLGGLRPVRNLQDQTESESGSVDRLFEWIDGPLVLAMRDGHYFLADEISLADDSVLERLNSVLEPERSLLLSEKAGGSGEPEVIKAADRFRFLATMNPGGDYGKKELSPALRNRLTEIWCPMSRDRQDIIDIADHNLERKWIVTGTTTADGKQQTQLSIAVCIVDFVEWFATSETGRKSTVSIRDILSWVQFINAVVQLDPATAYVHGACLVFLDSLGNRALVEQAVRRLVASVGHQVDASALIGRGSHATVAGIHQGLFGVDPFFIEIGPRPTTQSSFTFRAPSTSANLLRLLRALQLKKPLLLEGSPGVGKTSLVSALAQASGHDLVRINLSEQTDVSDLFGADLPVEGSQTGGRFEWRDGPLLRALKEGQWIVLDELNLASQSVLEGLNAILDHRGELYIPELGRSFRVRPQMTKLFACQNPLKQGGARKGLPRSFLNRFTQVYVDPLSKDDLQFIARSVYPNIHPDVVDKMVEFNQELVEQVTLGGQWGLRGGPWEFNLRDIFRWCQALESDDAAGRADPAQFVGLIYADRMRSVEDHRIMLVTYERIFGPDRPLHVGRDLNVYLTESWIQVGSALLARGSLEEDGSSFNPVDDSRELLILQRNLPALESLMHCVSLNWMTILVGPRASGKTSLVRLAAQLTGHRLDILNTNSAMDTTELLGGFEQGDVNRTLEELAAQVDGLVRQSVRHRLAQSLNDPTVVHLLQSWENYKKLSMDVAGSEQHIRTTLEEAQHLERRALLLAKTLDLLLVEGQSRTIVDRSEAIKRQLDLVVQTAHRVAGTGNSGGCFEWVDSLLVKALRNGHWLLVDNVNLCSSSVLDRLNGLLEPGGDLTLSERGVIDGQIPVVRPHPQFRLFLAMDPRHGEISRAMRNRGVEIFLPGSDEIEYPETDLASVLLSAGLDSPTLGHVLVQLHRTLCRDLLPPGERPTLTELVQAASLTAQRLEMFTYADQLSCLENTCLDVYIKTIRSPDNREAARQALSNLLQEAAGFDGRSTTPVDSSLVVPSALSTRQIRMSSVMARVLQAATVLRCLDQQRIGAAGQDATTAAVLFLYLTASRRDLDWRKALMGHNNLSPLADLLGKALQSQLSSRPDSDSSSDLPWDLRWFGNLCRKHLRIEIDSQDETTPHPVNNRISLALHWISSNAQGPATHQTTTAGQTLADLTRAIRAGSLAEEAAPDKLLVYVPRFLQQLDAAIEQILSTVQVEMTNEEWAGWMEALEMRRHMTDVDHLPLDSAHLESTLSQLTQYWCWLLKRVVPVVRGTLERFKVTQLDLPAEMDRSRDVIVSRRLRRWLEQGAEPFVDQTQSHKSRLVSSILSSCCLPSIAGSPQGREFISSVARHLSHESDDSADKLTQLERELNRLASELEKREQQQQLAGEELQQQLDILSLIDHILLLGHYRNPNDPLGGLMAAGPTGSAQLLRAAKSSNIILPWTECQLAHWEVVTRLSWSRRGQYLAVSPVFSLTAGRALEKDGQVALHQSDEKRARLQSLKVMCWTNADKLQRPDFDPLLNDHQLAVRTLQHLIRGVCHALKLPSSSSTQTWLEHGVHPQAVRVTEMAASFVENPSHVGSLWLLQGLARCLLLASGGEVDPVEKRKLKSALNHRQVDRAGHFLRIHQLYHQLVVGGELVMDEQHPHVRHLRRSQKRLEAKLDQERIRKPTWRPADVGVFQQLVKDVRHYVMSVASAESVLALHGRLVGLGGRSSQTDSGMMVAQAELWLTAQRSFYQTLKSKYADYPDIVIPLLAGIAQMIHGVELMVRNVKASGLRGNLGDDCTDWSDSVADLFDRPSRLAAQQSAGTLALAQLCTSTGVGRLFDAVFHEHPSERNDSKKTLLLSALKDIERYTSHTRWIDSHAWNTQTAILNALVASWASSEERRKQRQLEEENLYKSRTVHHEGEISDAEADKRALEQFFPSYEKEFDLEQNEDKDETTNVEKMETDDGDMDQVDFELSPDDQQWIAERHMSLLLRWARSVYISCSQEDDNGAAGCQQQGEGGFFMRYPLLGRITSALEPCLSTQFDRRLIGAHLMFVERVLTHGQTETQHGKGQFDFYYDPRVQEAILCRPVLEHLRRRVADLLAQWPGHAVLLDVSNLIDRILSFAVDSPIMKLVTGLEMLLTKCHEWEANAHRGVSISEDIHALSRLILRWRTLELDCWKMCLDNVERRAANAASKYWFHLYSTITASLNDHQHQSSSRTATTETASTSNGSHLLLLQSTLRQFMESATLGQYESRLRMLKAFAQHVALSSGGGGDQHDHLLRLLWHALLFYGQFLPLVVKRKTALRQPIEKRVRDFIKIMRWNDINYYALKEAVHKAHTTLHKHMKEWRDVLEQPARIVLTEPGVDLETDTATMTSTAVSSSSSAIAIDPFIASAQSMTGYHLDPTVASLAVDCAVLSRLPSLYTKSLTLCKKAMSKSPFNKRILAVDDMVGTVIQSVNQLQRLKVITSGADKEKQKKEAKSISMRKRQSLFQLFRTLQRMGISYRKGAFLWASSSHQGSSTTGLDSLQVVLPILEVDACLEHLPPRSSHSALRLAWDKGPHYYTRCLARLAVSAKLLEKPSSELGPSTVERLKGFAAQFMALIQDQWRHCSATLDKMMRLRILVAQLDGLRLSSEQPPESSIVINNLDQLWQLVVDALAVLEEFESLMKTCPSGETEAPAQLRLDDSPIKPVSRETAALLLTLRLKVGDRLKNVRHDLESQFHLFRISSAPSWLFSERQWHCIVDGFKTVDECAGLLEEMVGSAGSQNFGSALEDLRRRFVAAVQGFRTQKTQGQLANLSNEDAATNTTTTTTSTSMASGVDKLCQSVLHGIQEMYKKYGQSELEGKTVKDRKDNNPTADEVGGEVEDDDDDDGGEFEVDHLTDKLMTQLQTDLIKVLKLDGIISELTQLVELAKGGDVHGQLLSRCAPVFDQYTFVIEYYLSSQLATLRTSSKLLSVLLNVFNQLLDKGFCLPSELDDSKEGAGQGTRFEDNESGGLGEGEGAKDVSDQIESEDQLDSARQQGQPEEEEEKDKGDGPKEEDNGIEMSEDFDAELQDREKKEGDDDDDSDKDDDEKEDEDKLDKEMGDTGDGADQLEEKLWGSDDEEDGDDDQDQEEGMGDGQKDESQMTAKQDGDNEDDKDNEGDNDQGKDKKKEKPKKKNEDDDDEENVNDDQIDPYHTSMEPEPEPEPLDVPDDLNLDGVDAKDKEEDEGQQPDENPFDIDAMKNDLPDDQPDDQQEKNNEEEGEEAGKEDESKPGQIDDGEDDQGESKDNEADRNPDDAPEENKEEDEDGEMEGKDKEMEEPSESDNPQQADAPDKAVPSMDQPSETEAQPAAEESVKGTQDKTAKKDVVDHPPEEDGGQNEEAENEDVEGVGTSASRQNKGHEGQERSKVNRKTLKDEKEEEDRGQGKPRQPGQSDPERALANERKERILQVHTSESKPQREDDEGAEPDESAVSEDNLFEHVKKVDQIYDALVKDAATEEQVNQQRSVLQPEEEEEKKDDEMKDDQDDDVVMKDDDIEEDPAAADQLEAEKLAESKKKGRRRGEMAGVEDEDLQENPIEVEGEQVLTMTVQRGPESSFVTQADLMMPPDSIVSMDTVEQLRCDLEQRLATWSTAHIEDSEGQETWRKLEMVTSGLAQDLCEQLRLILEPSQASRLKGDYRTGKRLNMRKVIPYIASQFRKDRIWLRRTKPAQRNYQIVLAVDDSSSMADNRTKELAFESVALISKALSLLEAGQLGVVSFGENVQLLHPLQESFNDTSGPRILQQFTFEQKKTKVSELVDFVTALMAQARSTSSAHLSSTAQLMLIVSDGRGLFSEGSECVHQAIRRAKQSGLFMVFVILDNPDGKDSILDIRVPIFDMATGKLEGIKPYLDSFPFPFYVILRDIQTLPVVLSDALRQWFELVTSSSSV